jgi:hypothetical protein
MPGTGGQGKDYVRWRSGVSDVRKNSCCSDGGIFRGTRHVPVASFPFGRASRILWLISRWRLRDVFTGAIKQPLAALHGGPAEKFRPDARPSIRPSMEGLCCSYRAAHTRGAATALNPYPTEGRQMETNIGHNDARAVLDGKRTLTFRWRFSYDGPDKPLREIRT